MHYCCCCCCGGGGRGRIAADGMHGGMYGPLARWHEADMNVRWGALTNRKPMWGGSCTRSSLDGRFGSGVAGWLLLCFLRPSATPTKYSRPHLLWPPTVLGTVPRPVSSRLRRHADAVLQPRCSFSTKQLYHRLPTLPSFYSACLQLYRLYHPGFILSSDSASLQPRSYPCIFTLSILYTCLSFVPALNFDIRT